MQLIANKNRLISGDTLIEVLFSITVFSLLAVGGLSIMNQGLAAAQKSLEITLVRNEIDSQAEILRFLNYSYISSFKPGAVHSPYTAAGRWEGALRGAASLATNNPTTDLSFCPNSYGELNSRRNNSFILNKETGSFVQLNATNFKRPDTYARIDLADSSVISNGVWIEAVRPTTSNDSSNASYIDFHIRACWDSPGQSIPATLGTIVRLYEPL